VLQCLGVWPGWFPGTQWNISGPTSRLANANKKKKGFGQLAEAFLAKLPPPGLPQIRLGFVVFGGTLRVCFAKVSRSDGGGPSIPLPLIIVGSGQVLEAVLFDDGSAHRSGFYYRELIAAQADLLQPHREQAGVQPLLSIFGDG